MWPDPERRRADLAADFIYILYIIYRYVYILYILYIYVYIYTYIYVFVICLYKFNYNVVFDNMLVDVYGF